MGIHEPCQVRKEAALSGRSHVPQGSLGRANCLSNAYGMQSEEGARQLNCIQNPFTFVDGFFLCLYNFDGNVNHITREINSKKGAEISGILANDGGWKLSIHK